MYVYLVIHGTQGLYGICTMQMLENLSRNPPRDYRWGKTTFQLSKVKT